MALNWDPDRDPGFLSVLRIRIRDPLLFLSLDTGSRSEIRDGKKSGFGMNIPDPGPGMKKLGYWIRYKHPGSATLFLMNRKFNLRHTVH
jgi:hypothetical protein